MVHSCIVPGCKNHSKKEECKGIRFYTLPFGNEQLLQTWLSLVCRRRNEVSVHSRICSTHFIDGVKKGNEDVPQRFPWQKSASSTPTKDSTLCLTPRQIVEHDHCYCSPHYQSSSICTPLFTSSYLTPTTASDLIPHSVSMADSSAQTDSSLRSPPFRIELFVDNDEAIKFYTGFENYQLLIICFNFLGEAVDHLQYRGSSINTSEHLDKRGAPRILSPLNEFFLVLCRLRCSLLVQDLAYRFGISHSTVCRIFITWINFLYFKFKEINIWPSRQQVNSFLPEVFKNFYPTTRCIIDATEIFIQTPSNPQAQQLTFSAYKNHNTLKGLIAVTPSGTVSFVSQLYGGNTSDRELTERCGLLDLLQPGDSVMADRGFTIADLLDSRGVRLNIPPMKTRDQFTHNELTTTRRIASLRIHVERAIGRIKSFKILEDIPNNMAKIADQIFFVCSVLSTFRSPLCN